jgi:hypothetical protein
VNPPAAVQRPSAGPTSPQLRSRRTPLLLAVLAIAGTLLVSQLLASPHFVPRITFENPTRYDLAVEVSNGHDGWLPLGSMDARRATDVGEVYDVGDPWNVRVFTQSRSVGHFRVTRDRLERSNWHVAIPRGIGDKLEAAGVAPQP